MIKALIPAAFKLTALILIALLGIPPALTPAAMATPVETTPTFVRVQLDNGDKELQLRYPDTVRLDRVQQDALSNVYQLSTKSDNTAQALYWTGSFLWKADHRAKQALALQQQNVDRQIRALADHWRYHRPAASETLIQLAQSLASPMPGERIFLPLDSDRVRIVPDNNPALNGPFVLRFATRPNTVKVTGALKLPAGSNTADLSLPWQERQDAAGYLKQIQTLSVANRDYIWVIQPDGKAEQHSIAYWNRQHKDIAPGAILYLAFTDLPASAKSLNSQIIHLLSQRPF
ncbi:capsule biosynthesis GfcC family protein [Photobacterium sp. WH77]|uniref:capsule biosynthesis GfcC family protein n=1 Tax=unclassified Photobacterium TaxID=2628852 RepID=UPI001EDB6A47|nr:MULTISPECIES: capsule biosynthesis GfcC family protein [unclassified Photobacterium]MCG2835695.1 capsule biosynthesis GfcC family protein [Photobacterium sp. WH77]MCG2843308.1 capsule biosynthesis GfcC family protein [Photobacterium sp. WH80]